MTNHVKRQQNQLPSGTWELDPSRTTITITATKLGFFTVPATLTASAGTIEIGGDHRVAAIEITAGAGSYASGNAKRDEHIRSADFLDASNHPAIVFRADTVIETGDGYHAEGTVTVKGQRSPLIVEVTGVDIDAGHASFNATARVDRNAVGVDKLPSFVIAPSLQVSVDAHAELINQ